MTKAFAGAKFDTMTAFFNSKSWQELLNGLKTFAGPFMDVWNAFVDAFALGFTWSIIKPLQWFADLITGESNSFADALRVMGEALQYLVNHVKALMGSIYVSLGILDGGELTKGKSFFQVYEDLLANAMEESFKRAMGHTETGEGVNVTNNWGGVTVNQDFKDRQNPDRIAYSLKEVLESASRNRTKADAKSNFLARPPQTKGLNAMGSGA